MTNPTRWPWHCGVCGSHAESYTEEGARAALHEHFQLHPNADRRPVEVAIRPPAIPLSWWKDNEALILRAIREGVSNEARLPCPVCDDGIEETCPRCGREP